MYLVEPEQAPLYTEKTGAAAPTRVGPRGPDARTIAGLGAIGATRHRRG